MSKYNIKRDKFKMELFFSNGDKCILEYTLEKNEDDYIADAVRKDWANNSTFYNQYSFLNMLIAGNYIDEIDMRKVVGIKFEEFC